MTSPVQPESHGTNALLRVHSIIQRAIRSVNSGNEKIKCDEVWSGIFSIPQPSNDPAYYKEISNKLASLDDVICWVIEHIKTGGCNIPSEQLEQHITSIRIGISPQFLRHPWRQIREQYFTSENLTAIRITAYSLPFDERLLDADELQNLKDYCGELRSAVESSSLPHEIREIIFTQINKIEAALNQMELFGIKKAQEATNMLVGILITNPVVTGAMGKQDAEVKDRFFGNLKKVVGLFNSTCGTAKNVGYASEGLTKLIQSFS